MAVTVTGQLLKLQLGRTQTTVYDRFHPAGQVGIRVRTWVVDPLALSAND